MTMEGEIRLTCPYCGKGMRVPAKYAGKRGKCACGEVVQIPKQLSHRSKQARDGALTRMNARRKEESSRQDPHEQRRVFCKLCKSPLREIYRQAKPIGQRICMECFGKPGICPVCKDRTSTWRKQKCSKCGAEWDRVVTEAEEIRQKRQDRLPPPPKPLESGKPYIEVFLNNKAVRYDSLDALRTDLLSARITRHDVSRWVKPKPKPEDDSQEEIDVDNFEKILKETDFYDFMEMDEYHKALIEWIDRRRWRPIGNGLAKEEDKIRLLYHRIRVYAKYGFMIVWGVCLFILSPLCILYVMKMELNPDPESPDNILYPGLWDWLLQTPFGQRIIAMMIGMVIVLFISCIAGAILGAPVGALLAGMHEDSFPEPPDDGWVDD